MSDFRRKLARAFADAEIKTGTRVRRAEVNAETLKNIKRYIYDQYHPRMNAGPADPVGRVWGVDIYLNESLTGTNVIIDC